MKRLWNLIPSAGSGGGEQARREKCTRSGTLGEDVVVFKADITRFNGVLEPLFPFLVEYGCSITGLTSCNSISETLVQLNAYTVHLIFALDVHVVIEIVKSNIANLCRTAAGRTRQMLDIGPVGETVGGGIMNNVTLLLLVLFLGPFGSLPLGQTCDFGIGKLKVVESAEKASVPGPPREANTMSFVSVIEARVFRFLGVKVAVKSVSLLANLWDQVSLEEDLETLRIVTLGSRKHALVNELIDRLALHDDGKMRPISASRWY
jgi:hypothetical protein